MSPFQPIGDEPRWQTLLGLLRETPIGEVLTYGRMAEALDLDPLHDRPAISDALRKAAAEHEEADRRSVEVVKGEGYRVVHANEHLDLAKKRNKRAGVQLQMAYSTATNVDLSGVDPEVRTGLETLARGFLEQMEINRRLAARQRRTERAVDLVMQRSNRTEEEISDLKARLQAMETRGD